MSKARGVVICRVRGAGNERSQWWRSRRDPCAAVQRHGVTAAADARGARNAGRERVGKRRGDTARGGVSHTPSASPQQSKLSRAWPPSFCRTARARSHRARSACSHRLQALLFARPWFSSYDETGVSYRQVLPTYSLRTFVRHWAIDWVGKPFPRNGESQEITPSHEAKAVPRRNYVGHTSQRAGWIFV